MPKSKIFIHSMHRSVSTYVLKCFDSKKTLLYNEPFHNLNLTASIENFQKVSEDLNHSSFLNKNKIDPIFGGYLRAIRIYPQLINYHNINFDIINYIESELTINEIKFLDSLSNAAFSLSKIPVFGFVRSLFRVSQIRKKFNGFHIAQLRNPFSVWGSCWYQHVKGNDYFLNYIPKICLFHKENKLFGMLFDNLTDTSFKNNAISCLVKSNVNYYDKLNEIDKSLALCNVEDLFKMYIYIYIIGNLNAIMYSDEALLLYDDETNYAQLNKIKKIISSKFSFELNISNLKENKSYFYYSDFNASCDNILSQSWDTIISQRNVLSDLLKEYNSNEIPTKSFEEAISVLKGFLIKCSQDYCNNQKRSNTTVSMDKRYMYVKEQYYSLKLNRCVSHKILLRKLKSNINKFICKIKKVL